MKSEKEKMLAGEYYDCGDPELIARWHIAKALIRDYNQGDTTDTEAQQAILSKLLGRKGNNVWITPPFFCDYGENIIIGNNTEINHNCVFLDCNTITIGNNVLIAPSVQIYAAFHPVKASERIEIKENTTANYPLAKTQSAPITIGNNVWIGGGCIILPGVTIGDNTTIGAGSLVTKSIPANSLAYGNPCRVIREL